MIYETPQYSVTIVTDKGGKYYIKGPGAANQTTSLTLSEMDGQLAQKAVIKIVNFIIPGSKGGSPSALFTVKSKVYIYAKGLGKSASTEVFRGIVWENKYTNKDKKEVTLTCYDHLIYLMNSQTNRYYSKGKNTKTIMSSICSAWGVKLNYTYSTTTHPKLILSGTLADVITDKVLKRVKDKKGIKYAIKSVKGVLNISEAGRNTNVYIIDKAGRGEEISYARTITMAGMVTKVQITGSADSNGKPKIEAELRKNTSTYGTLQRVVHKAEDTKLSEVKEEANFLLKDKAKPQKTFDDVEVMDIPWVRKGDKIGVCFSGTTITYCIVKSVLHNVDTGRMIMDLENLK